MTKPIRKIRDGAVSASIFKNETKDSGFFYSVSYDRVYTDQESNTARTAYGFSGSDILKQQRLAGKAYDQIKQLEVLDKAEAETA